MNQRVVVTGQGAVTPLGNNVPAFWEALKRGESGVGPVTRFDVTDYPTRIAAEVKNFDPTVTIDRKEARRMDLFAQYAVVAAQQAVDDAELKIDAIDRERAGVIIGSGIGGIQTLEKHFAQLAASGPERISPFFLPMAIIDMAAGLVSMRFGFTGPNYATVSACASSAHAVGDAFRIIQRGEADLMLAGGAEASIAPSPFSGFSAARAMSTSNDNPATASRPFDQKRDGFVMGDGGGIVVLENLAHAERRGARILAEIVGIGMSADAYHMTAPSPGGEGAARAMALAVKSARISPEDVDYINAHGTSTELGDVSETLAIKQVFGAHARRLAINSTKSMIGHLLGAAGVVELIAGIMSLREGHLHPTINLEYPDPRCDLDYVPNTGRKREITYLLSNSFGFGGHNVSIAAKKFVG